MKGYLKGYKVFNPDWKCRGYQYEVGKIFEEDANPSVCNAGFHFCKEANDCFNYCDFDPNNKVAEIEAIGEIAEDGDKCATNKIHIVREILWAELLEIVNIGKGCTGRGNTGDLNTGNRNTGDWNTGNWNTGYFNTGNRNTGNRNTGDWNTGNWNTGDWNTGNWNTGDWNTGDWNTGCFNTGTVPIRMFNLPSEWTYNNWLYSDARDLLIQIPKNVVEWVCSNNMTAKEKAMHPTHKTTGGYLKVLDESESAQIWWDGLSDEDKEIIYKIPNFDAVIFEECTGINVGNEEGD